MLLLILALTFPITVRAISAPSNMRTLLTDTYILATSVQVAFVYPEENDMNYFWPGMLVPAKDRDPEMLKCEPETPLVRYFEDGS